MALKSVNCAYAEGSCCGQLGFPAVTVDSNGDPVSHPQKTDKTACISPASKPFICRLVRFQNICQENWLIQWLSELAILMYALICVH